MSYYNDQRVTLPVGEADIQPDSLVAVNEDGLIEVAGSTDYPIGVCEFGALAGCNAEVRLLNGAGIFEMLASGAIASGVPVAVAADGKVAASGSRYIGISLSGASEAGDLITVIPVPYFQTNA